MISSNSEQDVYLKLRFIKFREWWCPISVPIGERFAVLKRVVRQLHVIVM